MEAAEPLLEVGVPTDEELAPCTTCGRTFVISSLQRHSAVCKRNSAPSRGKFDSSRQRLQGTGLEPYKPPPPVKARPRSRSVPGECNYPYLFQFLPQLLRVLQLLALLHTGAKVNDVLMLHFIIFACAGFSLFAYNSAFAYSTAFIIVGCFFNF